MGGIKTLSTKEDMKTAKYMKRTEKVLKKYKVRDRQSKQSMDIILSFTLKEKEGVLGKLLNSSTEYRASEPNPHDALH